MSVLGRCEKRAGRFAMKASMPSRASGERPVQNIPSESIRWASRGWSAPSSFHSIWRIRATETADVLSAISRASSRAVASNASAATMLVRGRAVGAIERPAASAEVGARAERAAGAGDDHRPHAVVGIGRVERGDELVDRARGDGVEAVGTVQRDRRDGVGDVVQDLLVGHGALPRAILPDMSEAADAIEQLHARGVTDGLPVVPPTRALVDAMIAASDRRADELIASVAPANGRATIEKIAINAVMAGCRPEYMPVVVAAVRAMCDDAFDLVGISGTTDAVAPIFIVNGPARVTIELNCAAGALGPGTRAHATTGQIGRAHV